MPKCINDETKNYKGTEPSPKGLGYAASALDVDTIKRGKDNNNWIVKETKTGKRWYKIKVDTENIERYEEGTLIKKDDQVYYVSKDKKLVEFDFDSLPKNCYKTAYFPKCELLKEDETGLEEKFGGSKPFFTKDEEWPKDEDGEDMKFLCQFKDPRSEDDFMYRVFVSEMTYEYNITKINTKDKQKVIVKKQLEPYVIKKWTTDVELDGFYNIVKKLKLSGNADKLLWDEYHDHSLRPSYDIKVGGTPMSCQNCNYDDHDLLQLSESNILEFGWGDSGVAHISKKLSLQWDCF